MAIYIMYHPRGCDFSTLHLESVGYPIQEKQQLHFKQMKALE